MPASKVKVAIAQVLKDEGYIENFQVNAADGKSQLEIALKVLRWFTSHRAHRASEPSWLARVPWFQINSSSDEWFGCGYCDNTQGCHDRSQGARRRRGGEVLCYVA